MADIRYRKAEIQWLSQSTRDTWVAFMRESRLIGQPIFTANSLETALEIFTCRNCGSRIRDYYDICSGCGSSDIGTQTLVWEFSHTEDGFIAEVMFSPRPELEMDPYDAISYPIWAWWSGQVKVAWDDIFGCPILTIYPVNAEFSVNQEDLSRRVYSSCVANQQQLIAAFLDHANWSY
jgi:hypothetical protein